MFIPVTGSVTLARVSVCNRDELKAALREEGSETIELKYAISVRETITVHGEKVLTGSGELRRAVSSNSAFGGNLLRLADGSLTLKNITINGRGDAGVLAGGLYGWLIEIDGGQLNIGEGVLLKNNRNTTRSSDGGGAVRVRGGACVMTGGTITQNASVTGGAGVRVEAGGIFYMKGGVISGNSCVGMGAIEGFDGRGGGVLNRGTMAVYGGEISGNTVKGYSSGGNSYGGVGGGIANAGDLLLNGGSITGNRGVRGCDIGQIRGRIAGAGAVHIGEIWLKNGQIMHIGGGFSSPAKIRLQPESVKAGVKLVSGVKRKTAVKWFSAGSNISTKYWQLVVHDSVLQVEKRTSPTPTPVPTEIPGGYGGDSGAGYGGTNSGSTGYDGGGSNAGRTGYDNGGSNGGAAESTPRVYPSYIPVRPPDPEAEIWFHTPAVSRMPEESPAATVSHDYDKPALPFFLRLPMITPAPTEKFYDNTVSPPAVTASTVTVSPAPVVTPRPTPFRYVDGCSWHFSVTEIRSLKESLEQTDGLEHSDDAFFEMIHGNIVK